jgi:hypothetical protein
MQELFETIKKKVAPESANDAILLLRKVLPLVRRLQQIHEDFWPFCEAIDHSGTHYFYPKGDGENLPVETDEKDLQASLRFGFLLGVFRSACFLSPVLCDTKSGFCLEMFLEDELAFTLFVDSGDRTLCFVEFLRN